MTLSSHYSMQLSLLESITNAESQSKLTLSLGSIGQKSTKVCSGCKESLCLSQFAPNSCKKDNLSPYCKACEKQNREEVARLKLLHPKLTTCACCGATDRRMALDHDHQTRAFRGWICNKCNTAIGMLGDTLAGVLNAALYLSTKH